MLRATLHGVKDLRIEDVPVPTCPEDGLVIRVAVCAVCATDVRMYHFGHDLLQLPRVLGHEISGVVAEVGARWSGAYRVGERVAVCAVVNCGECEYCQRGMASMCSHLRAFGYHFDGGYQEYMVVPYEAIRCGGVNRVPSSVTHEEASVAELLACCINGQRLSGFQLGQSVLIMGAGPVGILHSLLAYEQGLSPVYLTDVVPERLATAGQVCGRAATGLLLDRGLSELVARVHEVTGGRGFDQVVVACSSPDAQQASLQCVAKAGCVNLFGGLPKGRSEVMLDTNPIHYKQCRVVGTHGSSVQDNRLALELIGRNQLQVDALITRRLPLSDLDRHLRETAPTSSLKAVVEFDESAM